MDHTVFHGKKNTMKVNEPINWIPTSYLVFSRGKISIQIQDNLRVS